MPFTQDELFILSDALLLTISENSEAMKHITSQDAIEALKKYLTVLRDLNSKVCSLSESQLAADFRAQEQPRKTPRVVIHVEDGMVQNVYADADVEVDVCDLDDDTPDGFDSSRTRLHAVVTCGVYKPVY